MTIRIIAVLTVAAAVCVGGCSDKIPQGKYSVEQMRTIPFPNRYDLPVPTGGMTLNVGTQSITTKEIADEMERRGNKKFAASGDYAYFREQTRALFREEIQGRVVEILLYEAAKKKAPENIEDMLDKATEKEIARFVASYGNNYALAEEEIRRVGQDWKTFRDFTRRGIMVQSYLADQFKDKRVVSLGEMLAYYNEHQQEEFCHPGEIQFRFIDIVPSRLDASLIEEGEIAEIAALRLCVAIVDRLAAGEDFAALAKQYSQHPLAGSGGLIQTTIGSNSLSEPYAMLEQTALEMDPNQIRGPLFGGDHLFILKLESRQLAGCQSFEEVQGRIEGKMQYEFRRKQYNDLFAKMSRNVDPLQFEQFLDYCLIDAYGRWRQL